MLHWKIEVVPNGIPDRPSGVSFSLSLHINAGKDGIFQNVHDYHRGRELAKSNEPWYSFRTG